MHWVTKYYKSHVEKALNMVYYNVLPNVVVVVVDEEDAGKLPVNFRMDKSLVDKVKNEAANRGPSTTDTAVYVEAIKFFFDNKDDPRLKSGPDVDVLIEEKMDMYFNDPNKLEKLRRRMFNL